MLRSQPRPGFAVRRGSTVVHVHTLEEAAQLVRMLECSDEMVVLLAPAALPSRRLPCRPLLSGASSFSGEDETGASNSASAPLPRSEQDRVARQRDLSSLEPGCSARSAEPDGGDAQPDEEGRIVSVPAKPARAEDRMHGLSLLTPGHTAHRAEPDVGAAQPDEQARIVSEPVEPPVHAEDGAAVRAHETPSARQAWQLWQSREARSVAPEPYSDAGSAAPPVASAVGADGSSGAPSKPSSCSWATSTTALPRRSCGSPSHLTASVSPRSCSRPLRRAGPDAVGLFPCRIVNERCRRCSNTMALSRPIVVSYAKSRAQRRAS